ncbi:hypothetical protein QVD17_39596 [Tagetes erecta]|uniref:Uncharacterized protein n=1 Tax=Tagetes erecta TaxID=13708 RepID=A0AAD8JQU6_TARER|nr:hypothetical protein QVD17_39596 [Tagetes erecta]
MLNELRRRRCMGNSYCSSGAWNFSIATLAKLKMSAVYRPHLQTSAEEEVDQTSAVCKKKTVCFLMSAVC